MDISKIPSTPCYVIDKGLLKRNLEILDHVQQKTGCKIILALKGFAMFSAFSLINKHLFGTTASSLDEARLGFEEFGKEVHVYAPAYKDEEIKIFLEYADHISFNSFSQWERFKDYIKVPAGQKAKYGLRINPEHSEVKVALYDPCAPGSRLGIRVEQFDGRDIKGITGLHFHTLCELNSDALERTLKVVEQKFKHILPAMEWINFGGGHHITRPDYDIDKLCCLVEGFSKRYNVQVYLEPGEAVALNTGVLVTSVLDIIHNRKDIAILDTSAAAHMPDVLEMPYSPGVEGAGQEGEYSYTYCLGGLTCLAGDVIGDYSFPEALQIGSRIVFKDMAHYTMVKNNTFNGIRLPSIAMYDPDKDAFEIVREFKYEDYRNRLS
ncbi:MAG: carboxynorspermidine decarboxylase [Candidatus Omnitrophota bacterium]